MCICTVIRSKDDVGEFCSLAEAFLWFSLLQKVIPKVEFLDLSHNQLSSVENLQVRTSRDEGRQVFKAFSLTQNSGPAAPSSICTICYHGNYVDIVGILFEANQTVLVL